MVSAVDRSDLPVLLLYDTDCIRWPAEVKNGILMDKMGLGAALSAHGHPVTLVPLDDADLVTRLGGYDPHAYIVFNMCDNVPGVLYSEAQIAQALEKLNFTYTGSTAATLELCWDKRQVKHLMDDQGVPTPRWRIYESPQPDNWNYFPAIVKPAHEHSSFGVTSDAVVLTPDTLRDRIAYVLDIFQQSVLVEEFIDGNEFHISVWGDHIVELLPPIEMDFDAFEDVRDRLCTFDSKFMPGSCHYVKIRSHIPALLVEAEYKQLERVALSAYELLDCRDYARVDIRRKGGVFYVLDINPNPDLSREASMACAANVAGYSYGAMASHLVNLAARRHPSFGVQS